MLLVALLVAAPQVGVTYDCGPGRASFRVVSCTGASCDLLYLNPYSPGGGSHIDTPLSSVEQMIDGGCRAAGQPAPQPQQHAAAAQPAPAPPRASCPADDHPDPRSLEGIFKSLIRARYEKADRQQGDPIVTVSFTSFRIGSVRKYRLPSGSYESEDGPGGNVGTKVYPVHAQYVVCSDYPGYPATGYRGEVQRYTNDNTFSCFQNAFNYKGQWQCNLGQGRSGEIEHIRK